MEQEANSIIVKMATALALIETRGLTSEGEKAKIGRLQKDLAEIREQFQNMVFWEQ